MSDGLPPLPVSKRTRVILEVVRTMAAVIGSGATIAVLLRVYGVL